MYEKINIRQLKYWIDTQKNDIRVIDLRSAGEYGEGHIPGSINIPFTEIGGVQDIIKDMNMKIFLYCQSGKHSKSARYVLLYLGYEHVWDIGGLERWPYKLVK